MVQKHQTSGWSVFVLAAFIPGFCCCNTYPAAAPKPPESTLNRPLQQKDRKHERMLILHDNIFISSASRTAECRSFHLLRNDSFIQSNSELSSDARIHHPVLQPTETIPTPGTYTVEDGDGRTCIRATMGAEFIIIENKTSWYFNLEPSVVKTLGYCNKEAARLALMLPDDSARLQFTFRRERLNFYVAELTAHLFPHPACNGCPNKTYSGSMTHMQLFKTANDQSFRCQSEYLLLVSLELKIKLVPLQIQAFSNPSRQNGEENECWADYKKRVIPLITGSVVVGVILCILLSFLIIRDHRRGYERL